MPACDETQFVMTLPCGCILSAREIFIPATSLHCVQVANISLDLELQYVVNIPYINAFFQEDMLSVVRDDSYLNHTIAAILPVLQIVSKEYDVTLSLKKGQNSKWILLSTRCSAIAERPRCRVRYSFRQK